MNFGFEGIVIFYKLMQKLKEKRHYYLTFYLPNHCLFV